MCEKEQAKLAKRFPRDRYVSCGALGVHGATAGLLVRKGILIRRIKDQRLVKVSAFWEYRRILSDDEVDRALLPMPEEKPND